MPLMNVYGRQRELVAKCELVAKSIYWEKKTTKAKQIPNQTTQNGVSFIYANLLLTATQDVFF